MIVNAALIYDTAPQRRHWVHGAEVELHSGLVSIGQGFVYTNLSIQSWKGNLISIKCDEFYGGEIGRSLTLEIEIPLPTEILTRLASLEKAVQRIGLEHLPQKIKED